MTTAGMNTNAEWKLVEEAVFGLFDQLPTDSYAAIDGQLAELGFAEIEQEYPVEAEELLFRAQGRSLAQTDCLYRVMLAELPKELREASAVLLPAPGSDPSTPPERARGVILARQSAPWWSRYRPRMESSPLSSMSMTSQPTPRTHSTQPCSGHTYARWAAPPLRRRPISAHSGPARSPRRSVPWRPRSLPLLTR